jgi:hypothetical protein
MDAGPAPHLDLDALADLLAAEGSQADVDHVAGCSGCAGRLDELATAEVEVAATLAALPAPPVPEGLAARLQAVLDAEPALLPAAPAEGPVATGDGARAVAAGSTVTPFPQPDGRRRTWLPAAAAAALLLVGGGLGATALLTGGGNGDDPTTSAAGGAADTGSTDPTAAVVRNETGTDYAADGALAASLPALLDGSATGPGAPAATRQDDAQEPPEAPAEAGPDAAVQEGAPGAGDPALDRLRTPEGLASCLTALLPPEDDEVRPLAVDYAAYQGAPALVVLLPASGAQGKVDVFVVDSRCRQGADGTMFFTRLDRP